MAAKRLCSGGGEMGMMIRVLMLLAELKTLYGTGTQRLNDAANRQERVGGIRWTLRDGIVFDAPALLESVAADVARAKAEAAAKN